MPPPSPWMLRPASNTGMLGARAQTTAPAVKMATATRYAARGPNASINLADSADPMMEVTTNSVVFQA
ncbi:hypothetical protein G6F68_021576 [Rhizopus microsporus]|nr:hypothetical protein G6F68_021576 [Rhizopus microsporus]